jgi:hypothetical protein
LAAQASEWQSHLFWPLRQPDDAPGSPDNGNKRSDWEKYLSRIGAEWDNVGEELRLSRQSTATFLRDIKSVEYAGGPSDILFNQLLHA